MSFTEDAVRRREKVVTRRKGWLHAKPGDQVMLCRKVMGRKAGEPLVRIVPVEFVEVRREPLLALTMDLSYGQTECHYEGFPNMSPEDFVEEFFIRAQRMRETDDVTRIRWKYLG